MCGEEFEKRKKRVGIKKKIWPGQRGSGGGGVAVVAVRKKKEWKCWLKKEKKE